LLTGGNVAGRRRATAHDRPNPTPAPAPGTRRAARWRRAARAAHRVTRREAHAARIRLDPPPAATLSSPRPGPVPPAQGSATARTTASRHFRIPAALRPEWHAGDGGKGRFTQSGAGYERPGRSRAPHAGCGPGGIVSAGSPALPLRGQAAGRITRPARRRARCRRPGAGAGRPRREKSGPAAVPHRQLIRIPVPIPPRLEPPGGGECAGRGGIKPSSGLPDLIRAQLVKQS
jgi:hypothetical protein